MDLMEALDRAADGFSRRLQSAPDGAWGNPTPCSEWDVRALVLHVVGGCHMTVALLDGASSEESMQAARAAAAAATDLPAAFAAGAAAQRAAFHRPGALDGVVHHVVGDLPAPMLLGFRTADMLLHSWDLARGLGVDDALDPEVLEVVWGFSAPMGEGLRASGRFGDGASGSVPGDAPLQTRLLDIHGRRP
jgi:uncharacterized protein (TIGR03086 family)